MLQSLPNFSLELWGESELVCEVWQWLSSLMDSVTERGCVVREAYSDNKLFTLFFKVKKFGLLIDDTKLNIVISVIWIRKTYYVPFIKINL